MNIVPADAPSAAYADNAVRPDTRMDNLPLGAVRNGGHGLPYTGRGKRCTANNNTCKGWKANGTEFCVGHLNKQRAQHAFGEVER